MKPLLIFCAAFSIIGCVTKPTPIGSSHPPIAEADRLLAFQFLRALYRPTESRHRVIADASAEEARNIPLRQLRAELSSRLAILRAAPRDTLRVVIHSGDDSAHTGYLTGDFHRTNGRFDVLPISTYSASHDLSIDVRHWPDGTRLVCVSCFWIGDMQHDIFHLRKDERIYRFAISAMPIDNASSIR